MVELPLSLHLRLIFLVLTFDDSICRAYDATDGDGVRINLPFAKFANQRVLPGKFRLAIAGK